MTERSKEFLKRFLLEHPIRGKVLDVGCRNINGSVKDILVGHGLEYLGLDMEYSGHPEELIINAHDIKDHLKEESFDLVICLDTLEHDDMFWVTVHNMRWVLKKGGWMLIIVPSLHCPIHEWPNDYYRFLPSVLGDVFFKGFEKTYFEVYGFETDPDAIYGWGQKP